MIARFWTAVCNGVSFPESALSFQGAALRLLGETSLTLPETEPKSAQCPTIAAIFELAGEPASLRLPVAACFPSPSMAASTIAVNCLCLALEIPRRSIIESGGGISVDMFTERPMVSLS